MSEPLKLLTVDEVAVELRVSNMTVYRLCSAGELPHFIIGKNIVRIPAKSLRDYLLRALHD